MKNPPKHLDRDAASFYRRHLRHCQENGSLHEATWDAYVMMAVYYSLALNTVASCSKTAMQKVMFCKYWQSFAVPFGLLGKKPPAPKSATLDDILNDLEVENAPQDEARSDDQDAQ